MDLSAYYQDDYYSGGPDDVGYADYAFVGEHSTAWAADLVDMLAPAGRVLDVGAADGQMLSLLTGRQERFAIEVNANMAQVCRDRGITVIGDDIHDHQLLEQHRHTFDVVTALAVLEHVDDMRAAVEACLALLSSDGVLIFEVPVLTGGLEDATWLSSSLEHVWYPTVQGMLRLFRQLGHEVVGGSVLIEDYASTFVGLVSASNKQAPALQRYWDVLAGYPRPSDLTDDETALRWNFAALHCATRSAPELTTVIKDGLSPAMSPLRARRVLELWARETAAAISLRRDLKHTVSYLHQVEQARDESRVDQAHADSALKEQAVRADVAEVELGVSEEVLAEQIFEYERLRLAHTESQAALQAVLDSTAWRIAAPVRSLGRARVTARRAVLLAKAADRRKVRAALGMLARGEVRLLQRRLRLVQGDFLAPAKYRLAPVRYPREPWDPDLPIVSVVVPCFNYGQYVDEAVHSALGQTQRRTEVIVVEGGSTDGCTAQQVRSLRDNWGDRVQVLLRDEPHLVGDNRNHGIEAARGRYICCLDADDLLEPTYLDVAVFLLEKRGFDLVSTAQQNFGMDDRVVNLLEHPVLADMVEGSEVRTVAVFRRDAWSAAGGYRDHGRGDAYVFEDWEFATRLVALGARVANIIGQPLFRYRVHSPHSLSRDQLDLSRHRRAIVENNKDVLTSGAFERAESAAARPVHTSGPVADLVQPASGRVILLLMPFLLVGGAERMISGVVAHLAGLGVRVIVATTVAIDKEFGDATSWFTPATDEVFHLPRLLHEDDWQDFVNYIIDVKQVDTIWQVGSEWGYANLIHFKDRKPDLEIVDLLFNTAVHATSNRRSAAEIDLTIAESKEVRDWLIARGARPHEVLLVPNGVDLDRHQPRATTQAGGGRRQLLVGWCGRLSDEKDPLAFVEAAAALADVSDVRFAMAGAGPLGAAVTASVRNQGASVEVLGLLDDVPAFLASLDVLVLPSKVDGRPNAVLEALASGVPVIASRVGGLPDVVHEGVNGFLVDPGDVGGVTAHLRALHEDRELLDRLSRGARVSAERDLDIRRTHAQYARLFASLPGEGLPDPVPST